MKRIIIPLVLSLLVLAGCIGQQEETEEETIEEEEEIIEEQYDDLEFMEWLLDCFLEMNETVNRMRIAIDEEDFYSVEIWAERLYNKSLKCYYEIDEFKVSDDYIPLKEHAKDMFYYGYKMAYYTKLASEAMIDEEYGLAIEYLSESKEYSELMLEEITAVNSLTHSLLGD